MSTTAVRHDRRAAELLLQRVRSPITPLTTSTDIPCLSPNRFSRPTFVPCIPPFSAHYRSAFRPILHMLFPFDFAVPPKCSRPYTEEEISSAVRQSIIGLRCPAVVHTHYRFALSCAAYCARVLCPRWVGTRDSCVCAIESKFHQ